MPADPVPALKRQLAREIMRSVEMHNYFVAASMLDLATSRFSKLRYGRVEFFSLDKLVRLLADLDRRVDISVVIVGDEIPGPLSVRAQRIARRNPDNLSDQVKRILQRANRPKPGPR
jgi:predicted XRE-type DNA-binding protein